MVSLEKFSKRISGGSDYYQSLGSLWQELIMQVSTSQAYDVDNQFINYKNTFLDTKSPLLMIKAVLIRDRPPY